MKKSKHQFHCERCGSPCDIYKKGKNHRVLVCRKCGVIATNPLPLLAAAAPYAISAVSGMLGKKKDTAKTSGMTTTKTINVNRDEFDTEERVSLALK
jgi:hypothetical protein